MASSGKVLKLKSSDSKIFDVEEEIAIRCETLKNQVEDGCADGVIPIPNVKSKTLSKVIEWCRKHSGDRCTEKEYADWKSEFMDVNTHELYYILDASNYLDVADLLDCCCSKAADLMSGKTPHQIRKTFGIRNDLTLEEEKAIKKKWRWAFQD